MGEADKTKAEYLISFRFKAKNDWKETMLTGIGSTGADTSAVERDFVSILDHMINNVYYFIQKRNIMRDQNKCIFIIQQITFQPCDMLFIQIVRRLVQQ